MESSMVINSARNNCDIVIFFFKKHLPQFSIFQEYAYSPYWTMIYIYEYIKITIHGEIGVSIDVFIEDSNYPLWQYDRSVLNKFATIEEEIWYQLSILKRFLDEVGY
jgi:hypothetical protein